jgi:hypothetical protein
VPRLFSYCVRYDDGAAPNPFGGACSLVICKPSIRRAAEPGDWIIGTGSKHSPMGDTSNRLIYAMRVTEKVSMKDYDALARKKYPDKVPDPHNPDRRRHHGDALYDFSRTPPRLRQGAHREPDRIRDLSGKFALLSTDFYYFGKNAPALPKGLLPIVRRGRGHRSQKNAPYVPAAVAWLRTLDPGLHGDPEQWEQGAESNEGQSCGTCGTKTRAGCDVPPCATKAVKTRPRSAPRC